MSRHLPSGRVTFAFVDVVESTKTFAEHGDAFVAALDVLQERIARHTSTVGGSVVKTEGDGAFLAFWSAQSAVEALVGLQAELAEVALDVVPRLQVRAGAHTGRAEPVADDYIALPVNVAARVTSTVGSGQVVVSQDVMDELVEVGAVVDPAVELGAYELKDVAQPVVLWRLAGDDHPLKAVPARRTNVAQPHTTFVGREQELKTLDQLVGEHRLVTVVGTGGLGKTRLVSQYALRASEEVPAGVWLVELSSLTSGDQVVPEVAGVLGLSGPATPDGVVAELRRRGRMVLVLDNCEHLIEDVADLADDLVAQVPELTLVCTSQERLEAPGEVVLRLEPMGVSQGAGSAEQLFRDRAETAGASLTPDDDAAVSTVCRMLDGVPLAVELAAARGATMPLTALAAALEADQVELRRRGGVRRHRGLEAVVAWSLARMSEPEQHALFALSVFPGRFTYDMAEAVLARVPGADGGTTAELVRCSLLDLDGSDYRMLASVAYAAKRSLNSRPDLRAHALDGLCNWATAVTPPTPPGIQIGFDRDQVRTLEIAASHAMKREPPAGGWIFSHVARWGSEYGFSSTTLSLAREVLSRPVTPDGDSIRLNLAALSTTSGTAHGVRQDEYVTRALTVLDLARATGREAASAAIRVAKAMAAAQRHEEAIELYEEAAALTTDQPIEHARALVDLGTGLHVAGRLAEAETRYRRAIEVLADDPTNGNHIVASINIGEVLLDLDQPEAAAQDLRDALLAAASGPSTYRAYALALLAEAEHRCGRTDDAAAVAREAERALEPLLEHDPSMVYARDRMRRALATP